MGRIRRAQRRKRRDTRRAKRKIGTSRYVHRLLRAIVRPFMVIPFRAGAVNNKVLKQTRPPYIVLGNHSSVLDPFLIGIVGRIPIQYVVSDSQFRNRFISIGLGLLGSVPKTKAISDFETVKNIVKIKREKGIIGIFPEGQNCWDGHSLPMVKSTFKLIKSLKIPVITAKLHGAYLTWPRWSPRPRQGRITIVYERVLGTKEIKGMSLEEVERYLTEKLHHDAFVCQRETRQRFRGAHLAEYLERVLFTCPSCGARHTLHSHRRRLTCEACGYAVSVTSCGFFEPRNGAIYFDNLRDWNVWQLEEFHRYLKEVLLRNQDTPVREVLMEDTAVRVQTGYKTWALRSLGTGPFRLFVNRIELGTDQGLLSFPLDDIEGINIQNNEKLEFYVYDDLYRITPVDPRGNTYKWLKGVNMLQELRKELSDGNRVPV